MTCRNLFFMTYAGDINRLVDFYGTAFGFEQKYRWPVDPTEPIEFVELVLDGRELWFALPDDPWHGLRPGASGEPVSHVLCLHTDDVDAEVSRLRASGVPVLYEPTDHARYGERMAYVADPDGRPIMLYSDIDVDESV
ncbi:MAG: VOC family protein [Pseudonocardiales bacterium]|nr:VOC family protein [Pseudonocardiales bacterium]MBV9030959.1 VOC family protein [Pseudonocardiales bacterium]MBV9030984.1 VOC family protein [Pseudonocardiales bacterium]